MVGRANYMAWLHGLYPETEGYGREAERFTALAGILKVATDPSACSTSAPSTSQRLNSWFAGGSPALSLTVTPCRHAG